MRRLIGAVLVVAALVVAVPVSSAGAGEAPGGGYETEKVIGPDSRRRVDPTTGAVARRTTLIEFRFDGRPFACTGFLVHLNVVATAGHCLFDFGASNEFATNIEVTPGANGASAPYGTCGATDVAVPSKWQDAGKPRWDFGAITLDCNVGESLGTIPLHVTEIPLGARVQINGYPGDKPSGTQWTGAGRVLGADAQRLVYDVDTSGGQSGAAITGKKVFGCVCAVGIHTVAVLGAPQNGGVRVNDKVVAWFTEVL